MPKKLEYAPGKLCLVIKPGTDQQTIDTLVAAYPSEKVFPDMRYNTKASSDENELALMYMLSVKMGTEDQVIDALEQRYNSAICQLYRPAARTHCKT